MGHHDQGHHDGGLSGPQHWHPTLHFCFTRIKARHDSDLTSLDGAFARFPYQHRPSSMPLTQHSFLNWTKGELHACGSPAMQIHACAPVCPCPPPRASARHVHGSMHACWPSLPAPTFATTCMHTDQAAYSAKACIRNRPECELRTATGSIIATARTRTGTTVAPSSAAGRHTFCVILERRGRPARPARTASPGPY